MGSTKFRWFTVLLTWIALVLGMSVAGPQAAHADELTPIGPTFRDANQSVTVPADLGIRYTITQIIDDTTTKIVWPDSGLDFSKPGTYTSTQGLDPQRLVMVTATPNGTKNTLIGTTTWAHVFATSSNSPTFDDQARTVTIPTFKDVEYRINGVAAEPGSHSVDVSLGAFAMTVEAHATVEGFEESVAATWTHTFPLTAPEPTYDNLASTITIPTVDGITYTINGTDTAPGTTTITPGTLVTITARNTTTGTTLNTWTHDFPYVRVPRQVVGRISVV